MLQHPARKWKFRSFLSLELQSCATQKAVWRAPQLKNARQSEKCGPWFSERSCSFKSIHEPFAATRRTKGKILFYLENELVKGVFSKSCQRDLPLGKAFSPPMCKPETKQATEATMRWYHSCGLHTPASTGSGPDSCTNVRLQGMTWHSLHGSHI